MGYSLSHARAKQKRKAPATRQNLPPSKRKYQKKLAKVPPSDCQDVEVPSILIVVGSVICMKRMKTIEKDVSQNTENLVKRLLYPKKICTPAMEKGRIWEEKAFDKYKRVMELEDHCNLAVTKCGASYW